MSQAPLPAVGFGKILVLGFSVKGDCAGMCEVFASQPKENYEPITRHVRLNGQSTSIRLERSFWDIIDAMASAEGVSTPVFLSTLQSEVIEIHGEAKNFTSLLRCACIKKVQLTQANLPKNYVPNAFPTSDIIKYNKTIF